MGVWANGWVQRDLYKGLSGIQAARSLFPGGPNLMPEPVDGFLPGSANITRFPVDASGALPILTVAVRKAGAVGKAVAVRKAVAVGETATIGKARAVT